VAVDVSELLAELFDRVGEHVRELVVDLDDGAMLERPTDDCNPVGWLVWHLTRVQDHQLAELIGQPQVWVAGDWGPRFGLASDPDDHGYGHTREQVAAVRPSSAQVLLDYFEAVQQQTRPWVAGLAAADLDRVVDESWDPPVTLGVRLVSVVDDEIQHAGQAAYLRGLLRSG
jgi:hypothetical protein